MLWPELPAELVPQYRCTNTISFELPQSNDQLSDQTGVCNGWKADIRSADFKIRSSEI
jgi:hypothetical protein